MNISRDPRFPPIRLRPLLAMIPPDIAGMLLWLTATLFIISEPIFGSSVVGVIAALPVILFIPGYLLIGILFPAKDDLDWIERIAFSVLFSAAIVPLSIFILNSTPFGITFDSVTVTLMELILVVAVPAIYRRNSMPVEQRLSLLEVRTALDRWSDLIILDSPERPYWILLILSILLFAGVTVLILAMPPEGEHYTEFYLLDTGRSMTNLSYPDLSNATFPLVIAIRNHEYRQVTYTVEVIGVNSTLDPITNTSVIQQMTALSAFNITIPQNETMHVYEDLALPPSGCNVIQFLLFMDDTPDPTVWGQDRVNRSYRHLDLMDVPK